MVGDCWAVGGPDGSVNFEKESVSYGGGGKDGQIYFSPLGVFNFKLPNATVEK